MTVSETKEQSYINPNRLTDSTNFSTVVVGTRPQTEPRFEQLARTKSHPVRHGTKSTL